MKLCPSCMQPIEDHASTCPYCGYEDFSTLHISIFLPPGTILNNRYYIGKALGHGGFGITYIGKDMALDRTVAIKEYYPTGLAARNADSTNVESYEGEYGKQFYSGLDKFIAEAKRLAAFGHVPGIVQIYDGFRANNTGYIVMEYLRGCTIKDLVKEGRSYTFEEAAKILVPVLDTLDVIHSNDIIHRDIAPDNIFITDEEKVMLIDFGASYYAEKNVDKTVSVVLKHGFAPEEQYKTHPHLGPWTDIYGVSATLYYLLTGEKPVSSIERIPDDVLKLPSALNGAITHEQEAVILKGMAVRAEDRYQSAKEMKAAILACMPAEENTDKESKENDASCNEQSSDGMTPPQKGNGKLTGILAAVALVAVATAIGTNITRRPVKDSDLTETVTQTAGAADESATEEPVEYLVTHIHSDGTTTTDKGSVIEGNEQIIVPSPNGEEEYAAVSLISGQPTVSIDYSTGEAKIEADTTFSPVKLKYYYQTESSDADADAPTAWFGMLADASGSLSYSFYAPEPIIVDENFPVNEPLTDEQIAKILDRRKTDNYAMGFENYRYYIEMGEGKNEYSPLAYWGGESAPLIRVSDRNVIPLLVDSNYIMAVMQTKTPGPPGWYAITDSRTTEIFETLSTSITLTGGEPVEMFVDEDKHLCCTFYRSVESDGNNRRSYVCEKKEGVPTRIGVLQSLISELVLSAEKTFDDPKFSLMRFSKGTFEDEKLLCRNWTDDPAKAVAAMNQTYSNGKNIGEKQEDGTLLYNYGITSDASTRTGLRAFLHLQASEADASQKRVLLLMGDGTDTDGVGTDKDENGLNAIDYVQKLKDRGYTVVSVLFLSSSVASHDPEAWLSSCASLGTDDKPLFWRLDSADEEAVAALADEIMETLKTEFTEEITGTGNRSEAS